MYCALSARPSFSADLSPCTGCYKLILLTLYGGPAAAVRQCHLNNIHFYYYYYCLHCEWFSQFRFQFSIQKEYFFSCRNQELWPIIVTDELDLTWSLQGEPLYEISRSEVTLFKHYRLDTHTHIQTWTWPTALPGTTSEVVSNDAAKKCHKIMENNTSSTATYHTSSELTSTYTELVEANGHADVTIRPNTFFSDQS